MDGPCSALDWSSLQFGTCELGDARRTKRAVSLGARLVANSSGSLPRQTGSAGDLKAAYRLLAEEDVTHAGLSAPHWERTRRLARTPGQGAVLFVQDGTELDYAHPPQTKGLGFVGGGTRQGIELHTTLCVLPGEEGGEEEEPEILGMAHSHPWTRDHEPRKGKENRAQRDARHKETDVWGDCVEAVGKAPDPSSGTRWVSVSDRGSDIFSFLTRTRALGWKSLVRSKHDRKIEDEEGESGRLHRFARALPASSFFSLDLRARPGKPARAVSLRLAWSSLTLLAPSNAVGDPIPAWCVRVWEENPPAGVEALEWILVSTEPVECEADALRIVGWYKRRWLVEEYHKCLKTGCRMESRQVRTKGSLMALLGFLGVVAVFLLQLKDRANPVPMPPSFKAALGALSKRKAEEGKERDWIREIAMLGGFLGRKGDGEPGWQTVWHGWKRLQDVVLGIELGKAGKCG
ncbi:MAG: IS4 family transposase [Fimbriimonas sp.]